MKNEKGRKDKIKETELQQWEQVEWSEQCPA
jgi:hypothetical protein